MGPRRPRCRGRYRRLGRRRAGGGHAPQAGRDPRRHRDAGRGRIRASPAGAFTGRGRHTHRRRHRDVDGGGEGTDGGRRVRPAPGQAGPAGPPRGCRPRPRAAARELTAIAFYIGPVEITGFGLMVGVGALAGLWVLQQEAEARGLPPNATNAGVAGVVGGLIGAKVLYVAEHLGREPAVAGLLSRGGMSWFGGVAGGALLALAIVRALRL